jgi:YD repeat-containing protein
MDKFLRRAWHSHALSTVLALGLLAGCGGGGGGASPAPAAPTANAAPLPALTLAGQISGGAGSGDVVAATGTYLTLDASGTKDPEGDAFTFSWSLTSKPSGSTADIAGTSAQLTFKPDMDGTYVANLHVTDSKGASADKQVTIVVRTTAPANTAPQVVVLATVPPASSGSNTVSTALGYTVALTSGGSKDPSGAALSYAWTLVSKPAASTVKLSSSVGVFSQLVPDVMGDYVVQVIATNASGVASSYQTTVSVKNQRPQASIGTNAVPTSQINGPTVRLPANTTLTLRGTGSTDADGDVLTYTWTLEGKPAGSTSALSSSTGATVQLTTDVSGSYAVRLRVTDPAGAYSEQVLSIESGNTPPTAQVDKTNISIINGAAANVSAAYSSDADGDTLTYAWAIDARPAGSSATIATPSTAQLAFVPDVAGMYVASVTVSDGKSSSLAYVTIRVLSSTVSQVTLPFTPGDSRYSKGLDRFVAVAANPNALHIVDPYTGAIRSVPLPLPVKAFNLSADGKLAAVLEEGVVSLVDLPSATLLHSSATGGSQTDAFVTNAGVVYMVGQTGGQWVSPAVTVVDGRTGTDLTASLGQVGYGFGYFYGTQRGIFAASKNKAFVISNGLSPADISYFTLDPTTGAINKAGDSPYHGDYAMGAPFFLSSDENLLFTSSGNYFKTDTLQYAGKLSMTGFLQSMSQSASANEAIVLSASYDQSGYYPYPVVYQSSYHRFTGPLYFPDADVALPMIGGQQSYGVSIFHSGNDNHVVLVQTGSANPSATGLAYYLITR